MKNESDKVLRNQFHQKGFMVIEKSNGQKTIHLQALMPIGPGTDLFLSVFNNYAILLIDEGLVHWVLPYIDDSQITELQIINNHIIHKTQVSIDSENLIETLTHHVEIELTKIILRRQKLRSRQTKSQD
jgi:hypothetical protein